MFPALVLSKAMYLRKVVVVFAQNSREAVLLLILKVLLLWVWFVSAKIELARMAKGREAPE